MDRICKIIRIMYALWSPLLAHRACNSVVGNVYCLSGVSLSAGIWSIGSFASKLLQEPVTKLTSPTQIASPTWPRLCRRLLHSRKRNTSFYSLFYLFIFLSSLNGIIEGDFMPLYRVSFKDFFLIVCALY